MQLFCPIDSFLIKIADRICNSIISIVEKLVIPGIYYSFTLLLSISILPMIIQCILLRILGIIVSIIYLTALIFNIESPTLTSYHSAVDHYTENMYKIKNHTLLKLFGVGFMPLMFVFGFFIVFPLDITNIIISRAVVTLTKEKIKSTGEYRKRLFKIAVTFNIAVYAVLSLIHI